MGLEKAVDLLEVEDAQHAGIQPFLGDGPLLNGGEDGPVGCLQVLGQEQDVRPRLEGQQSGMAHALNVGRPLELIRGEALAEKYGIEAWAVDGTPTDSVKLYLEALAEEKPDVVVSGINHGANLATDILYSGTVGAAMEGMLHDISSFAVSLDVASTISYDEAAEEFALILERVMAARLAADEPRPVFWNVNFPRAYALGEDGRPQVVFGRQGKRDYKNAFLRQEREDGRIFYTVAGEIFDTDKSERRTSTPSSRATSL